MTNLEPVDKINVPSSKAGPRTAETKAAQRIVEEFAQSGHPACRVLWRDISDDFDVAKRQLSSRINWTKWYFFDYKDLGIRTNRATQEIYLIRKDKIDV